MSDCTTVNNLLDNKRVSNSSRRCHGSHTPQTNPNCKRIKRSINKCLNRVTFAMEDVYIVTTPYESGINDADVIRLYHNDIWYTKTDYNSFLQDRINTIRVYHSVKGNMSGLQDYYCIYGLESFLDQPVEAGHSLKQINTSALTTHLTYEISRPSMMVSPKDTLPNDSTVQSCDTVMAPLRKSNAAEILEKEIKNAFNAIDREGPISIESTETERANVDRTRSNPTGTHGNDPEQTTIRKNKHSVDVKHLRLLNMKLLKSMCAGSESNARSLCSMDSEKDPSKSNPLLNFYYSDMGRVDSSPSPLTPDTSIYDSELRNAGYKATLMNVMNRALEITSACIEPNTSSMQLMEIPDSRMSHGVYEK